MSFDGKVGQPVRAEVGRNRDVSALLSHYIRCCGEDLQRLELRDYFNVISMNR